MGISSATGLVSGINVDQIISQIQQSEQGPIQLLQAQQSKDQQQSAAILAVSTKLSTLAAVASAVNNPANFNTRTANVTDTPAGVSLLAATANSSASAGSYVLAVKQLAQAQKTASQGIVDQNTTAIAGGDGAFKFKVGNSGTEYSVSVSASTTLQGLRDAINSAGGSVTASIINDGTGSNPFRLVLAANSSGANNTITITNNDTTLDFTNKKIEDAFAATTNSFSGTVSSNSGSNYTGTTNKTFLVKIVSGGAAGAATYKYSTDGGITFLGANGAAFDGSNAVTTQGALTNYIDSAGASNATNEGVQIAFGAGTLVANDTFTVDAFNPTLQTAQDAVVQIDNSTVTKTSNTITDAIQGVTLNLTQADPSNSVNLSVSTDTSGLSQKIHDFVSAYNDVNDFLAQQFTSDPTTGQPRVLATDSSIRTLHAQLRNIISGGIPGLTTGKANLSQIGISSDAHTGTLTVDDGTLSNAISADPDGVKRLFLGVGTPTNSAITVNSLTAKTTPGTYGVAITVAPQKATLGGVSDPTLQDLSNTGLTSAEVLSFTFSSNFTDPSPATSSFAVTLTAGSRINDVVSALNSAFATQNVGLSASNDSGRVKITSTNYGADTQFTVVSDQAGTTQTGIGTVGRTAQGTNIAGTINNHAATGKGDVLTSNSGFEEDGLSISTETTTTGLFGNVTVSRGVGDQLASTLDGYTNSTNGIFIAKTNSLTSSINSINTQISTINDRITAEGDRLRAQLVNLESVLGQYQTTSNFLTAQLAQFNLPAFSSVSATKSG